MVPEKREDLLGEQDLYMRDLDPLTWWLPRNNVFSRDESLYTPTWLNSLGCVT